MGNYCYKSFSEIESEYTIEQRTQPSKVVRQKENKNRRSRPYLNNSVFKEGLKAQKIIEQIHSII